jgi:hypothetical protein
MAMMLGAVIADTQMRRRKGGYQALRDLGFDGAVCHGFSSSKSRAMGKQWM